MFERYTAAANGYLFSSLMEAIRLGSAVIEPEHLLLAFLRPTSLSDGADVARASTFFSDRMKSVLRLAEEGAEDSGPDTTITPAHLLLALTREQDGKSMAALLLMHQGLTYRSEKAGSGSLAESLLESLREPRPDPQSASGKGGETEILRCSFCNKDQNDVRKLIAGPTVFICDECVGVATTSSPTTTASRSALLPLLVEGARVQMEGARLNLNRRSPTGS